MTVFTEGRHPGEGLMSEANGHRSRDNIVVAAGAGIVIPATVLGRITATGKYVPSPDAVVEGIEGAEVACAVAIYGADATTGDVAIAAISRDAEWNIHTLTFDPSVDTDSKLAAKLDQLRAVGIIVR